LGFALLAGLWFIGTVVLLLLAVATKPKNSVPWPHPTQVATASLAILAFFWPVVNATKSPSSHKAIASSISPNSGGGASAAGGGAWRVNVERSAMDGSKTVTVFREAENDIQGWLEAKKPTLLVRCKEGETDVYVATGMATSVEYGTDTHTVRLRFDDGVPITQQWNESTGNDALFAPNALQLAKRMVRTKTLAFEFTPFNANPAVARFDVEGLRPHLDTVANACGWQITEGTKREAAREAPREGDVAVISWPQGGSVSVDGGERNACFTSPTVFHNGGEATDCLTPVTVSLTPGSHRIEIVKTGYQMQEVQVLIKSGETSNVEVTLAKQPQ
jgi:hypothetical protein